jgi:23S rRNA C2498 (ribose-2'-O)-methylase RlmM
MPMNERGERLYNAMREATLAPPDGWRWRIENGEVTIWTVDGARLDPAGNIATPDMQAWLRCVPGQELDVLRRLFKWARGPQP